MDSSRDMLWRKEPGGGTRSMSARNPKGGCFPGSSGLPMAAQRGRGRATVWLGGRASCAAGLAQFIEPVLRWDQLHHRAGAQE